MNFAKLTVAISCFFILAHYKIGRYLFCVHLFTLFSEIQLNLGVSNTCRLIKFVSFLFQENAYATQDEEEYGMS